MMTKTCHLSYYITVEQFKCTQWSQPFLSQATHLVKIRNTLCRTSSGVNLPQTQHLSLSSSDKVRQELDSSLFSGLELVLIFLDKPEVPGCGSLGRLLFFLVVFVYLMFLLDFFCAGFFFLLGHMFMYFTYCFIFSQCLTTDYCTKILSFLAPLAEGQRAIVMAWGRRASVRPFVRACVRKLFL